MSSMTSLRLRRLVTKRAADRCEFCLIHQDDVPQHHEMDHLVARKHGGRTVAENLALTCLPCNRHKGSDQTAMDPETQTLVPLFNPRIHAWREHFELDGARIRGLTPTGRATANLLQFNFPVRVDIRRWLIVKGRYPQQVQLSGWRHLSHALTPIPVCISFQTLTSPSGRPSRRQDAPPRPMRPSVWNRERAAPDRLP